MHIGISFPLFNISSKRMGPKEKLLNFICYMWMGRKPVFSECISQSFIRNELISNADNGHLKTQ